MKMQGIRAKDSNHLHMLEICIIAVSLLCTLVSWLNCRSHNQALILKYLDFVDKTKS